MLVQVLLSICSLLTDPNPDDPLVPEIAHMCVSAAHHVHYPSMQGKCAGAETAGHGLLLHMASISCSPKLAGANVVSDADAVVLLDVRAQIQDGQEAVRRHSAAVDEQVCNGMSRRLR